MWISIQEQNEIEAELAVQQGKRRLDIYRRIRQKSDEDTLVALGKLTAKNKASKDLSDDFKFAMAHIVTDIVLEREGAPSFDGISFPTEDATEIVRCVHEGVCPICGRHAFLVGMERVKVEHVEPVRVVDEFPEYYDWLPEHDGRMETTVECGAGHKAVASPTLHDWSGWIEKRHPAGFDFLFHTDRK